MIIMNTNDFMITWLTGNEHVVEYQIYNRLFTLGSTVFALAMTPVWSAVTKAAAEKDYRWIQSLYKRMLYVAGIGVLCEMLIIPCLPILVKLWLGANAIATNAWYGCAFAMLGMMMIFNSIYSSIANGLGRLKTQTIWFCVGAILKYPIAMLLVRVTGSWIGVPIANAVVLLVYSLAEHINLKHYLRQLNNGNEKMTLPD